MRLTHTRQADLNLLVALAVLLEERQISTAAERYFLSQPAMSRTLCWCLYLHDTLPKMKRSRQSVRFVFRQPT